MIATLLQAAREYRIVWDRSAKPRAALNRYAATIDTMNRLDRGSVRLPPGPVKEFEHRHASDRMRTLSIDTSLAAGSVAACSDDATAVRPLPLPGEHARLLATALREAAAELGWEIGAADVVAVVRGPGSFTGLRVGVAAAKGIAWTSGARLVGVSGFAAIAWKTARAIERAGGPLEIAYDAGRGDVYAATATPCGDAPGGWSVEPARLVPAESWIATIPHGAVVAGPALAALAERLTTRPDIMVAPSSCWTPDAAAAAAIARAEAAAGRFDDPAALVPDYLRPSYAEDRG